jgi:hypothetical protein
MNKYFKHILFEGDNAPKVNIICDVLNEGLRSEFRDKHNRGMKNVVLIHSNSLPYIEYSEKTIIFSPFVPYGIEIEMFFEKRDKDMLLYDEIVFMEPYPFTLGEEIRSELEIAEGIVKANSKAQFKILFYRNNKQRTVSDDITGIDQALNEAPNQIKSSMADMPIINAMNYCVYRTPKDLFDVVHGGCGDLAVAISTCTERFKEFSERIKPTEFYGPYGEYKDTLEFGDDFKYNVLLQPEAINKLTDFRNVKGCDDVLKQYVSSYIDMYQELILELIEKVYIKYIGDICFWDLERDIISLKEGAKKVIRDTLFSASKEKVICPLYEAEYNKLVKCELKIDIKFAEKAVSLVNVEMMDYLHSYLLRKEELLAKTFD